jgi:long-chain acyl-CoA synthetase
LKPSDLSPGPNIIREYFKNPEATKKAFTSDGWFRTGDISYFSNQGKLFIVGRSKVGAALSLTALP